MSTLILREHLTADLLECALKNALSVDNVKVVHFSAEFATKGGDNYTSDIFRVFVDYELPNGIVNKLPLIVKYMLLVDSVNELLDEYKIFDKEGDAYSNLLPKLSEIDGQDFAPKCYYTMIEPAKIFVLEDLSHLGYEVADRQVGLDLKRSLLVVQKLGKFHAASMVLVNKNPKIVENYNFGLFKRANGERVQNFVVTMFQNGLKTLMEYVEKWSGFEEIIVKLEKVHENILKKSYDVVEQGSKFKVINHGDLWTNNMMFKLDKTTREPLDILFIDFQVVFYTSLGLDLNYFIHTSPNASTRNNNRDDLIENYYASLKETLIKLNFDSTQIPSLEDVKVEIDNYEFYGFLASIGVLPLAMMERKENVESNLENMQDEEKSKNLREIQMQGKHFQEAIKPILKRFNERGLFD